MIGKVAPTLGSLLGPGGTAAGAVIGQIAKALGAPENDEEALAQAVLNATPEQIAEIKRIENDFKVRMRELDLKPAEMSIADRASARAMATAKGQKPQVAFTSLLTLLIFAVVAALFALDIPPENKTVTTTMLGVLIREWAGSMNFWFGTSIGSQRKDERAV